MTPENNKYLTRKKFIEDLYKPFCESFEIEHLYDYSDKLVKSYSNNKEVIRSQLCKEHNIDYHKIISGTHFTIFSFLGIKPKALTTTRIQEWGKNEKLIEHNINFALFVGIVILHKWTDFSIAEISKAVDKENFKCEHKKWLYRLVRKIHKDTYGGKRTIDMNDVYALSQIWYLIEENIKERKAN